MPMKYSIIIPIYNAAKTLRRCLDSLVLQGFSDYELLLINDGSTDGSQEICNHYAAKYPNVVCYCQENLGVSAARNLGLEHAQGRYVLFVDSDDYVVPDYFHVLDQALEAGSPELVFFSFRLVGKNTHAFRMPRLNAISDDKVAGTIAKLLRQQKLNALWSKVFDRSVIERNQLRFDEKLFIDEDVNFIFSFVLCAKRLRFSPDLLYNTSLDNPESLTRRRRGYLCEQLCRAGVARSRMLNDAEVSLESKVVIRRALSWLFYRGAYSSAAELLKYPLNRQERRAQIHGICRVFCSEAQTPEGIRSRMIAFPVQHGMSLFIDLASCLAVHKRFH